MCIQTNAARVKANKSDLYLFQNIEKLQLESSRVVTGTTRYASKSISTIKLDGSHCQLDAPFID